MSPTLVYEARVTSKGQIVVPARLRRKLGIKTGTRVRFVEQDGDILFQAVTPELIIGLAGVLRSKSSIGGELVRERAEDEQRTRRKKVGKLAW